MKSDALSQPMAIPFERNRSPPLCYEILSHFFVFIAFTSGYLHLVLCGLDRYKLCWLPVPPVGGIRRMDALHSLHYVCPRICLASIPESSVWIVCRGNKQCSLIGFGKADARDEEGGNSSSMTNLYPGHLVELKNNSV